MKFLFCVSAVALLAGQALAEPKQVQHGPPPAWVTISPPMPVPDQPTGPVFVRRQDAEAHLTAHGQAEHLGYRVKILQSSGLAMGNISIKWNPGEGEPIVHEIKIYRDGQIIDALKDAKFEILRREDQLEEAAKLDGVLTAVYRIPDLRVGDELEVELTTFSNDPTLGQYANGVLFLAPSPSPGRYHVGLSWEAGQKPNLKMSPDMATVAENHDDSVDFRFDNPAVLSPPKDAPPRYIWQNRVVEYSAFRDWAALSRQIAPLFDKASQLSANSPVKLEAERIAAAHAAPFERASAALKLVQQDVRYIYVGLNGGNMTPATADETWQRRYGDCKGKTALLLALLNLLGIRAEAVLVNSRGTDDGFDQRLPLAGGFDHVLVRAHIDGKDWWLDGTLPPVAAPTSKPLFPLRWVLPLSAQGSPLEQVVWRPAATPDEISLYEIDARAGFDKPALVKTTQIVRGVKGLQQQLEFSAVSGSQLLEIFRQRAIGDVFQSIEDVQWRYDSKAAASILTVSGTGKVDWDDDGDGARSLALPGGGFNPPERRLRSTDQDQSAPFYQAPEYICHVTTVRLPANTQPGQWSSKPSFDQDFFGRRYHRAWEMRDGTIRVVRGSRVEQPEIDMKIVQGDNARIAEFDNSMGLITYDPHQQKSSVGKGEIVPATYSFDWTADDVPCLSSRS